MKILFRGEKDFFFLSNSVRFVLHALMLMVTPRPTNLGSRPLLTVGLAMDLLTVLSLAGNIIQFIDFSNKLISAIHQIHTIGELDALARVGSAENSLRDYATKLQQPLHSPDVSGCLTEDEIVLERIFQECTDLAGYLISLLTELKCSEKRNLW
jgi:hypothetical protein